MICEDPTDVNEINKIPFLPISFLKQKKYYQLITLKKYFTATELQPFKVNISFSVLNFIINLSLII